MPASVSPKVDCPLPPPSRQTTYGVSEAALRNWLEGREEPPQMVFLAAIEIILLHLDQADAA